SQTLVDVATSIETRRFRRALYQAMELARLGNRYLDAEEPWQTVKSNPDKAATTLWTALNVISTLRTVFYPFIPFSSDKIHNLLGFDGETASDGWRTRAVEPGAPLPKPRPLFRKLEPEIVEQERERLLAQQTGNP
ncbi:MAG: class I tRNA ligase family protein, partial [Chloroflexi bacterium]|nr:class I tRNA ligase family protein [Chloroflexota bacterium]